MFRKAIILLGLFSLSFFSQAAEELDKPSGQEALVAMGMMMGLPQEMLSNAKVKLGTCIPAANADHEGQIACTIAFIAGASTSETQVDFYRDSTRTELWVAAPSASQDQLPFPDPQLQ